MVCHKAYIILVVIPSTIERYTYGNTSWGDQLTAFNGTSLSYDALGNPLQYYNGNSYTFTWQKGRQLSKTVNGGVTTTYTYNSDGIRTGKTVGGVAVEYVLDGVMILAEKHGDNVIRYFYDASGSPVGMIYGSTTYLYEKNLQGDIVAMWTTSGVKVASYVYDAWGNIVSESVMSSHQTASDLNPFRYRGYYYDQETGFYYLQSRYYDPATGRFLNADSRLNGNGDIQGFNMYAYCSNNPMMNRDDSGESIILTILTLTIPALIGAVWMGMESYRNGNRGWDVVEDTFKGLCAGLFVGSSILLVGVTVCGPLITFGKMSVATATHLFGMELARTFAIGALVYNLTGIIVGLLWDIDVELIELDQSSVPPIPIPNN